MFGLYRQIDASLIDHIGRLKIYVLKILLIQLFLFRYLQNLYIYMIVWAIFLHYDLLKL